MSLTNVYKRELTLEDCIKVLDHHYPNRFTSPNYYTAYYAVCERFGITTALLPHREYRQRVA